MSYNMLGTQLYTIDDIYRAKREAWLECMHADTKDPSTVYDDEDLRYCFIDYLTKMVQHTGNHTSCEDIEIVKELFDEIFKEDHYNTGGAIYIYNIETEEVERADTVWTSPPKPAHKE